MGWFGTGAMDGDDGMDLQSEIFHKLGILEMDQTILEEAYKNKTPLENHYIFSDKEIGKILHDGQDTIYDWLRDYEWDTRHNPGFIQEVYIQGTAQLLLDYGVKISERGKPVMLDFIKNDHWSDNDKERKESMTELYKAVEAN